MTVGTLKAFFNNSPFSLPNINFGCEPIKLSLGTDDKREISLEELSHVVKVIRNELIRSEFTKLDPKKTGFISSQDLQSALSVVAEHKLNPTLKENISKHFSKISFPEYAAIISVLSRPDTIAQVLTNAKSSEDNSVTPLAFATACMKHQDDQFTPLEISIIFKIVNNGKPVDNSDLFAPLTDPSYTPNEAYTPVALSPGMQTLKSVYNFALGSVAGAVGAAAVYPIGIHIINFRPCQNSHAEPKKRTWK